MVVDRGDWVNNFYILCFDFIHNLLGLITTLFPKLFKKRLSFRNYFNISMSYRHDADILLPYGKVLPNTIDDSVSKYMDIQGYIQKFSAANTHLGKKSRVRFWFGLVNRVK